MIKSYYNYLIIEFVIGLIDSIDEMFRDNTYIQKTLKYASKFEYLVTPSVCYCNICQISSLYS
jgi:hypothetical protein